MVFIVDSMRNCGSSVILLWLFLYSSWNILVAIGRGVESYSTVATTGGWRIQSHTTDAGNSHHWVRIQHLSQLSQDYSRCYRDIATGEWQKIHNSTYSISRAGPSATGNLTDVLLELRHTKAHLYMTEDPQSTIPHRIYNENHFVSEIDKIDKILTDFTLASWFSKIFGTLNHLTNFFRSCIFRPFPRKVSIFTTVLFNVKFRSICRFREHTYPEREVHIFRFSGRV